MWRPREKYVVEKCGGRSRKEKEVDEDDRREGCCGKMWRTSEEEGKLWKARQKNVVEKCGRRTRKGSYGRRERRQDVLKKCRERTRRKKGHYGSR